ncbi:Rossmann-like and DUF2520 domain-containing protein [Dermabacteraceae bacterium P13147]
MGIGIIGAGRVGAVLGSALRAQGHAITGAYAVSEASRERAELLLQGVPLLDAPAIWERSEVVLLAVPDDQLGPLVSGAAEAGFIPGGQIVLHTSGRYGTQVLAPAEKAGAIAIALHPAMTFTGTSIDLPRLQGCPFAVTARAAFLPIAQALAVEIGGEPFTIAEADRPLYHAALAHGANHLVTLVEQSRETLRSIGIDEPGRFLTPLLSAALQESLGRGIGALTGPVARGDAGTVASHLECLGEVVPDVQRTYRDLSRATTEVAYAAGAISAEQRAALLSALETD